MEANGTKGTMMMESWTPTVASDQTLEDATLKDWIFQALGAASMCWRLPDGKRVTVGEFDSREAQRIGDALHAHVQSVIHAVVEGTIKSMEGKNDMANDEWAHLAVDWPKKNIEELRAKLKVLTDLIGPVRQLDDEGSIIEWLRASDATVSGFITRVEALERDNENLRYRLGEETRIREKVVEYAFSRINNLEKAIEDRDARIARDGNAERIEAISQRYSQLEAMVERVSENMATDLDQVRAEIMDWIPRLEGYTLTGSPSEGPMKTEDFSPPIGGRFKIPRKESFDRTFYGPQEEARPIIGGVVPPIKVREIALRDAARRVNDYMTGSFSEATIKAVLAAVLGEDVPPAEH